jgi:hypothetical protein
MDTPDSNVSMSTSSVAKPRTGVGKLTVGHRLKQSLNRLRLLASLVRSTCCSMCAPNCCTVCSS